jgi:hypothetical protein
MPNKLRRLDGMTGYIVDEATGRVFLVAPSAEVADEIVRLWNEREQE